MKKFKEKDQKKRNLYACYEKKKRFLKAILKNKKIKNFLATKAASTFALFPKDSSIVRLKNRCILTGRSRSVFSYYRFSRIVLRKLGRNGLIVGLSKSN